MLHLIRALVNSRYFIKRTHICLTRSTRLDSLTLDLLVSLTLPLYTSLSVCRAFFFLSLCLVILAFIGKDVTKITTTSSLISNFNLFLIYLSHQLKSNSSWSKKRSQWSSRRLLTSSTHCTFISIRKRASLSYVSLIVYFFLYFSVCLFVCCSFRYLVSSSSSLVLSFVFLITVASRWL